MKRLFLLLLISLTVSYANAQDTKGDYYTPEIECLGVEEDGSQTLRSWGVGRNKQDAIEQAKKNAVKAVLFKGIQKGNGECNVRPLIYEVNAQERYQYYFNIFFKDDGEYLKFVSMEDTRPLTAKKKKNDVGVRFGITVRVLRAELLQRLIEDKIVKP